MKRSLTVTLAAGALGVVVMWSSACATGASAVTASTYARASVYRSATAHVQLPPEQAFKPVIDMLLARGENQDLADDLIWRICARLGTACDIGTGES